MLNEVIVDLNRSSEEGHMYAALSRARRLRLLRVGKPCQMAAESWYVCKAVGTRPLAAFEPKFRRERQPLNSDIKPRHGY